MQSCSSNLNIFALCDIFAHILVCIQVYMYTLVYILNCTACTEAGCFLLLCSFCARKAFCGETTVQNFCSKRNNTWANKRHNSPKEGFERR